jgi:hypothetical protein
MSTMMRTRTARFVFTSFFVVAITALTGCNASPRDSFQQWVARDAWDQGCAEQGMVEQWKTQNGRWKTEGQVYVIDVEATIKLANACNSVLPNGGINVADLLAQGGGAVARSYKQFETVAFKKTVEMSKCKTADKDGWSLPGQESRRCWTGPSLLKQ